jgi:Tfp pilus assembly protein PilO
MKAREFVVCIYVIAFFLSVGGIGSVYFDLSLWKYIAVWQQALFAFYLLVGFCGTLVAYWVYEDGEDIEELEKAQYELRSDLRKQTRELEELRKAT